MKNVTKRNDIILIASLLLVAAVSVGLLFVFRQEGKSVRVDQNGRAVAVYSLDDNGEYPLNGGTNILVIENGEAYIKEADCPDRTCVKKGRISYVRQSIVCLPNEISVTVIGDDPSAVDLVS